MSFTYQGGANPAIDYPRLLISDTQEFQSDNSTRAYIFEDSEILAATQIQRLQFSSAQLYSSASGANMPDQPVPYLRIAAILLDALSANKARLASIKQLLDVRLDSSDAAIQLRATAAEYRDVEDNAGAFAVIEQCTTTWNFRDRWWAQVQRQSGGGY